MIATITPDRGDRKPFMDHCLKRVLNIIGLDNRALIIDHAPISDKVDLIPRIKEGIRRAKYLGIDNVAIVESDDYYTENYLNLIDTNYDFFGWDTTIYYNIRYRRYQKMYHETHSSLFTTAFKISALDKFEWPPDEYLWLDVALWKYAKLHNKKWKLSSDENPCLGVKHGYGKCAGKGHILNLREPDPDLKFLRSRVNDESFEFYSNLKL